MLAFFISPKAIAALILGLLLSLWVSYETSWWWLILLLPLSIWTAIYLQIKSLKEQWMAAKEAVDNPRKFVENKAYDHLPIHQRLLAKWAIGKYKKRK